MTKDQERLLLAVARALRAAFAGAVSELDSAIAAFDPPGLFASLTDEQRRAVLDYRGEENHGDPAFATPPPYRPPSRPFLRRREAAEYLREFHAVPMAPQTLAKMAVVGDGPPFRKAGRYPLYARADLDAWAAERLGGRRRNTSERV